MTYSIDNGSGDDSNPPHSSSPSQNGKATPDRSSAPFGFTPFPTQALPDVPGAYVAATSEALDVAPAFLAVPMLSVLSAGVGASVQLELKRSWREPATLWTAVVAPSGSTKSAALQQVLRPVHEEEKAAQETVPGGPVPIRSRQRRAQAHPHPVSHRGPDHRGRRPHPRGQPAGGAPGPRRAGRVARLLRSLRARGR